MKKEMKGEDAIKFVQAFLAEEILIENRRELELKVLWSTVNSILSNIGRTISVSTLFEAFRSLSYHISVVEPKGQGENLKPYDDTNSHSIYIGLNREVLKNLEKTFRVFEESTDLQEGQKQLLLKLLHRE